MSLDPDAVTQLLVEAGQTVVLPKFRNLREDQIGTKSGPNDLVTAADIECEAFLTERLTAMRPGSAVVGEEAVASDPDRLDMLTDDSRDIWIIDPIDGTYNFAHGDERFAILLALAREGETQAGWIHFPTTGQTYCAELGSGAYRDGDRLEVAGAKPVGRMTAVLYVGKNRAPALYDRIQAVKQQLGARRFARCVATEYAGLAAGEIHYAIFTRQLPWDHAAGCLIHAEAGGAQGYFDGTPYRLRERDLPLLLAPDADTWNELRAFFDPEGARGVGRLSPRG
jgi:fructose-1,6-bisphosphatase/inositol monophosphatase family enzyme